VIPEQHRWYATALAAALLGGPLSAQTARSPATDTVDSLLRTAEAHHYRGELARAHGALAAASELARRRDDTTALARVWLARGNVWVSQTTATNSGYAEADSAASTALRFAERSGDRRLLGDATELVGRVLYSRKINLDQGDYEQPLLRFRRSLELRRAAGDTRGVVESLFRVGLIHERRDESAQAIALYEEALALAADRYPLERSNLARHLAYQRQGQGDLDGALRLFVESLELRERAGFVLTRASALTSIADLHRRKGDHGRALEYGSRALKEARRLQATRFEAGALISLGQTHAAAGDTEKALELLRRAEALAASIGYMSGAERARREREEIQRTAR
jgi:tetratricopeptide (TPR) repeat protein